MPEHHSAASEHSILQEITAPLEALPDDPLRIAAPPEFPIVLRGYDRLAVDAYVKKTSQLVAELHATRTPEAAVRRALERVGEQISGILQRAHDTAEEITTQSRAEAEDRLERARVEAEEIINDARLKVQQLDADTDRIWAERDRIVIDMRRLADELGELAGAASARFPAEPEGAAATVAFGSETRVDPLAASSDETQPTETYSSPRTRVIDLMHLGRERVIGCWQVDDVLIDPGPGSCLETLLEALGDTRPRAVLLTHIHLDHAGATGSLVARWPELEVYVHERGAPHMIEPARLLDSAMRLYGAEMDRLWGEFLPVPEANLRILRGGETVIDGLFEVAYTPGHASHHVSYLHDGTAFVGDTGGVRITEATLTIPPTPPPDVDLEAWHRSIELIAGWRPDRLAITHFGAYQDVDAQLDELSERLDNWAALARTEDLDTFCGTVQGEILRNAGADIAPAFVQAAVPEQLYAGLVRYWRKRSDPGSGPDGSASVS
jgi:glyoxylase-like metal-dependent hydrolase (beta-lactamase superfamily II)